MAVLTFAMGFLLVAARAQEDPIDRYLLEKDKTARARLLADIRGPLAEVERRLRIPPARPPSEDRGQVVTRRLKAQHPLGGDFEYVLWVPGKYVPDRTWRLIVSLHGQNGSGDQFIRNWLGDIQREGSTFLLCPSAGRGGWGHSTLGYRYILDSLRDVLSRYAIDPDLVFIDGASMGGNGSFQFACVFPDLFAGAAPRAGGPLFRSVPAGAGKTDRTVTPEGLENLLATPIYWVVGAKDPEVPNTWVHIARGELDSLKSDFTYREFPDGGHEWFPQENDAVLQWMAQKRRDPYPPRVGLDTNERAYNRNFWLEISEFRGQEVLKRNYLDLDRKAIEERTLFLERSHARAEISRESNEIKVTVSGAREIRIYLHERMVDLSKPVWVTVNGSKSKFEVRPSLETLMESARRDRGLLYTAAVRVKVP
jgi:pimeloyl-ACP methyl ester carboxylesterase